MELKWHQADRVELVSGYSIEEPDGRSTATVTDVRIAIQGGFLHIAHPGENRVQVVSAPAVRRVDYTES